MRKVLPTFALLSVLALPAGAFATTFDFTAIGAGGGFSGSGTLFASADGGGTYTITNITGTDITGFVLLGGFDSNDNLLFPTSTPLVDTHGFAFTANQGNTDFTVDIFSVLSGGYNAHFLDNDGFSATIPVTFSLTNMTVPEPSGLLLLATGMGALAGMVRLRLPRAT